MSYTTQYEKYTNSYDNIIKVLNDMIESGEVTPGSQGLLEEAYVDYNNNYADTLNVLQTQKEIIKADKIDKINRTKVNADKQSIIDILTDNGVNNSIFLDDDNHIVINGESIPELNQVKLTIDEQNKKIESIVSGGEIEIDGEKKSVQVAFTDLKQTVDGISTTVTDFKQTVENDYYTREQTTAQITTKANEINSTVANTYATKESVTNQGSQIKQNTDKISMIVADDSTASKVILTNSALSAISENINLTANNIKLEGYTTINGGFKVDEEGNIEATNAKITGTIIAESGEISSNMKVNELNVEGNLSADTLTVRQLNCQNIANLLVDDVEVTVNASSGNDLSVFKDDAVYATLQGCIEAIPKNLNGNTVTVTLNSVATENIVIKGFNGGNLVIKLNKNIEGNIKGQNCNAGIIINGSGSTTSILKYNYKLTGNLNMRQGRGTGYNIVVTIPPDTKLLVTDIQEDNWGYTTYNGLSGYISLNTAYTTAIEEYDTTSDSTEIKPAALIESDNNKYSTYFENCNYVEINNVNVYSKTEDNAFAVGSDKASNVKVNGVRVTGSQNGVHASNMGRITEINTSGKVSNIAHKASLGGVIYIENGTMINGSMDCSNSSQIVYSNTGAIKDSSTTDVGSNTNTTTATSTVTLRSSYGDTYRSTVYFDYKKDNTVREGNYGYGNCNGIWLFDNQFANQLKGKTIKKITLTVTRTTGGIYGNVTSTLKMHTHATKPAGMPTYASGWSQDFICAVGDTITITITDSAVLNAIKNGTCKGFGVQSAYDKAHYAVFTGSCTLTAIVE